MKRKIVPIALTSVILGVLFDYFFYGKPPGVSLLLFSCLVLGATVWQADLFHSRLSRSTYWLMPVILFFAAMVFIRASGLLIFCDLVLVMYLMLLGVQLSTKPNAGLQNYTIRQYFQGIPWLPLQFLQESHVEMRRLFVAPTGHAGRKVPREVLRGVLFALPILIVFGLLLSSADLVFHSIVTSVFRFHLNGSLVLHLILIGLITSVSAGAFALLFMRPRDSSLPASQAGNRASLGSVETSIVLGSVAVLFLLFLIIQATYLFGGAHHVLTSNFTYAEYARRGFFELIAVAAVSLLLIWFVQQSSRFLSAQQEQRFKWLATTLIAEVIIIMVSAHTRMSLYEQVYGFTRLRLLAHLFIYWLALAFVLVAIYIIRAEQEQRFAFRLFLSVLAFFAVLNLINPDALIARHNINQLRSTGKLDATSLTYLSEDATLAMVSLLGSDAIDPNTHLKIGDTIAAQLYNQKHVLDCRYPHWQSANLARSQANSLLAAHFDQLRTAAKNIPPPCSQ